MKEYVTINLEGAPEAYKPFIQQRNAEIAKDIASYMSIPYCVHAEDANVREDAYIVPAITVDGKMAESLGIRSTADFYGTYVDCRSFVGKSILHPSVSSQTPTFYSDDFAKSVIGLVLPGFTGFTKHDISQGYSQFPKDTGALRLKLPNESDGNGQYVIQNNYHLAELLLSYDERFIQEHGLVLETNVYEGKTISLGFAIIGGNTFSFVARQKNDIVRETSGERNRYKGAHVVMVKGDLSVLQQTPLFTTQEQGAIQAARSFYAAYQLFGPVASRLSFDVLTGYDRRGNRLRGVTDITGRLGGTCPALMVALDKFRINPTLQAVASEVTLNYTPEQTIAEEEGAKLYLDHKALRITARINAQYGGLI